MHCFTKSSLNPIQRILINRSDDDARVPSLPMQGAGYDRDRILIVGCGAARLQLTSRLGNSLGRRGKSSVTLVDKSGVHVRKPLLHEVESGSIDSETDAVESIAAWSSSDAHSQGNLGRGQRL
jgi:hypothetical protein